MNPQLQQSISTLLTTLENKLGVASNMLWTAMIRQQRINGILDASCGVFMGILFLACVYASVKAFKKANAEDGYGALWAARFFLLMFVGVGIFCTACVYGTSALTELLNPQWSAVQMLLGALK